MLNLEKRIAALESSANGLYVVIVQDGETEAKALQRLCLPADARAVFLSELDERL